MPFQSANVTLQPAPAVAGDFASTNPYASVVSPVGGFIAAPAGVTIAQFAWIQTGGLTVANAPSSGTAAPDGFIHRDQQGLITTYLTEFGMSIPGGFPVTLQRTGDYWCKTTVSPATPGQKAFASLTNGTMQPGAAGATITGYVETPFFIRSTAAVGELAVISQ